MREMARRKVCEIFEGKLKNLSIEQMKGEEKGKGKTSGNGN